MNVAMRNGKSANTVMPMTIRLIYILTERHMAFSIKNAQTTLGERRVMEKNISPGFYRKTSSDYQ